jgi:hypothetical protein
MEGGGYVGICGGTALITGLKTKDVKLHTFLEIIYNKSSLDLSCVTSYYKNIATPLFYPFQFNYPEKVGASAYVFSFGPGETIDNKKIHTGGVPVDFQICKDHPIFSDLKNDTQRIRWWGGPGLIIPKNPDRKIQVLATYPDQDISKNENTKINAWKYTGGIRGILKAFLRALKLIKKEKCSLKKVLIYSYLMAGNWELTDKTIDLGLSKKPSITAEIYPNKHKARILLCTSHPEYMVWKNGYIEANKDKDFHCLATGLHKWKKIDSFSHFSDKELTHNWWMVRRFVAWAAKIPDNHLPPIDEKEKYEKLEPLISEHIYWDGSFHNLINNI